MLPIRYQHATKTVLSGGFGNVQKVRDSFLDRDVLFKSMQDKKNNEQLITEIQALAKVRSQHVVEIYDVVVDELGIAQGLIIELLKGREYGQFFKEAKANFEEYLRVLYQIATALADLHDVGIVHRDLKLENFRDSASGILKLFDFGISTTGDKYYTKNNRGTVVYAAPELYAPNAEITREMDVYAFGVCAWALASESFPAPLLECPPQQSARAPSLGSVLNSGSPIEVLQLIDKCLDPNPVGRPPARTLSKTLFKHLVRGRHKGLFAKGLETIYELSNAKRNVNIKIPPHGEIKVIYDDTTFLIADVAGDVFVNNWKASIGLELPQSCVITFGDPLQGSKRVYIPFSSSHPSVIL